MPNFCVEGQSAEKRIRYAYVDRIYLELFLFEDLDLRNPNGTQLRLEMTFVACATRKTLGPVGATVRHQNLLDVDSFGGNGTSPISVGPRSNS